MACLVQFFRWSHWDDLHVDQWQWMWMTFVLCTYWEQRKMKLIMCNLIDSCNWSEALFVIGTQVSIYIRNLFINLPNFTTQFSETYHGLNLVVLHSMQIYKYLQEHVIFKWMFSYMWQQQKIDKIELPHFIPIITEKDRSWNIHHITSKT